MRGYNQYLSADENNSEGSMMDVGMLIMEEGDRYTISEPLKEVSMDFAIGKMTVSYSKETVEVERPNPFDYNSTVSAYMCR